MQKPDPKDVYLGLRDMGWELLVKKLAQRSYSKWLSEPVS